MTRVRDSTVEKIRAWSIAICAVVAAVGSVISVTIATQTADYVVVLQEQGNSREARILRLGMIAAERVAELSGTAADLAIAKEARNTYESHMAGQARIDAARRR